MQCPHFDADECRSCTLMGVPHRQQVTDLCDEVRGTLAGVVPDSAWGAPFAGAESGYRNKAKLAIGGTRAAPTFGILDRGHEGVDLHDCGLYEPTLADALGPLTAVVTELGLVPFDVGRRTGEFKHLLVTASPDGELMVRFVLRSPGQLPRIRRGLGALRAAVPGVRVVSANIQPEHKAVLEGEEEVLLGDEGYLPMQLGDLALRLRPGGFLQTNTVVATALYRQAQSWVAAVDPRSVLDLYCGVGGFALSAALADGAEHRDVLGIEASPEAVEGARSAVTAMGGRIDPARVAFRVGDARDPGDLDRDLVVVNPPRRGIGDSLCRSITAAAPGHVIYSSCKATTLARDLAQLPDHRVVAARFFDMFPQTRHHEVMVLAEHVPPGGGTPGRP